MIDDVAIAHLLLAAVAMISCLSVENKRTIRTMPRGVWITAILLVPVAGPVGWFFAGRPYALTRRRWRRSGRRPAPDDDTDFLRSLDRGAGGGASRQPDTPDELPDEPRDQDGREPDQREPDRREPDPDD